MPAAPYPLPDVLQAVLDVSLAATQLLRPIYSRDGAVLLDFSLDYCNPAGQLLTGLPEREGGTLGTRFPQAAAAGLLDYYRRMFETGDAVPYVALYQADGLNRAFRYAAQRQGEWLVVSFIDLDITPDDERSAPPATPAYEVDAEAAPAPPPSELELLFAQAPVAMALFRGVDYVIELANEPMAAVWGRPLAQVLGQPVFAVLPEVRLQGFEAIFADVLAHGTPHDLHEVPVTIDRAHTDRPTQGYFNLTYRPQHDAQGRITGIITSAQEVTEQVLARQQVEQLNQALEGRVQRRTQALAAALHTTEQQREQLRVQQGLLSQILGQVPAAIATLSGPEHRYTFFNELYQGLAAGRARLGSTVAEVFSELVEQGIISLLDQVYQTGKPFLGTEIVLMLHDPATGRAEQHYLDFTYQPLLDGQQRTQGILIFALDVTARVRARKQAETLQAAMLAVVKRQAQERENLYQLFEQAPAAICLLREPDHRVEYLNPAYQALFPGQVLRGRTAAEIQPEATALVQRFDGIYETGQVEFDSAVPVAIAPPGEAPLRTRYFDFTYQAYREAGRIAGVSVFGFDVTEQVLAGQQVLALNQELRDTNLRLTRTNADLDTFVYTASHDLKAPIANIEGLLVALRQELPWVILHQPLIPRLLGLMQDSVERFQQTIGHLTHISQLQEPETAETVRLAALIADVRLDLAPLLEASPVALTVSLQGDEAVRVAPKTLRSVVYNLLSNAVKYRAPARPTIVQVRGSAGPDGLVLEVQDNGLGLSPAQQAQLFGMFRRLHTHVEGSGVGLFMVKRLVENAGGTITVASEEGVGSTFTVVLPA